MENILDLKKAVRDKVQEKLDEANLEYGISLSMPNIIFRKMGQKAGSASYWDNTLEFNLTILQENGQKFVDRTPGHELAHLVSYKVYGSVDGRGHGKCWQSVMRTLGLNPERTHNYDVRNAIEGGAYIYHCNCQEWPFSKERHNNIALRGKSYYCKKCKGNITKGPLVGENEIPQTLQLGSRTF